MVFKSKVKVYFMENTSITIAKRCYQISVDL